ncbi:MAG: hypothetical protein ACHQM6_04965, partial [Candidatus Kapaibacterium sp.]
MKIILRLSPALLFLIVSQVFCFSVRAQPGTYNNYLVGSLRKYGMPHTLRLTYDETQHQLYHSSVPWQTYSRNATGCAWIEPARFETSDTLQAKNGKRYVSKTVFDSTCLLNIDFGDTVLSPATKSDWYQELIQSARYSPVLLLNYFLRHATESSHRTETRLLLYTLTIDKTIVTIAIRSSDTSIESVRTLENDDLRGDVETVYSYSSHRVPTEIREISVPDSIEIVKFNGKVKSGVKILSAKIVDSPPMLIEKPTNFRFTEEISAVPVDSVEKFSDHIHFIDLKHTEARSMIVEFSDFMLVIDAPLASKNGEMIINEVRKIAPNKPIRYFAFGHHHPWYVGGMRPFIYRGTTVLTTAGDIPYLNYLASAAHTLDPDSLAAHPQPLHTEEIHD